MSRSGDGREWAPTVEVIAPIDAQMPWPLSNDVLFAARRAGVFAARAHRLTGEISIAFVTDDEIADLNRTHRGVDGPTDVLTFPAPAEIGGGDIAIATGYLLRQAALRGVTPESEAAILTIHGILHLAGFDDLEEMDRIVMQAETKRLADDLEIPCDAEWTSLPEDAK